MSYINRVLQPGETVRYVATLHWVIYWRGILALIAAAIVYALTPTNGALHMLGVVVAALLLIGALYWLGRAVLRQVTTEYAVTNKRVIFKQGLVWRKTKEINMDKVASVDVDQSIAGRLLNYGDVHVQATGFDNEPIRDVGSPLEFRNHITAE
jgi:uncharacterized membrane protein YdbT with pleckstrin-like domain